MAEIRLTLRELHMHRDGDRLRPINGVRIETSEGQTHPLFVVDGVVYAVLLGSNFESILAPIKETPSELSTNPHIRLVEIHQNNE